MIRWLALGCTFFVAGCVTKAEEPDRAKPLPCSRELEQLTARLHEARRCKTAQDCRDVYYLPCPFSCSAVLNVEFGEAQALAKAMRAYGERCDPCSYRCMPLDSAKTLVCDKGLCRR